MNRMNNMHRLRQEQYHCVRCAGDDETRIVAVIDPKCSACGDPMLPNWQEAISYACAVIEGHKSMASMREGEKAIRAEFEPDVPEDVGPGPRYKCWPCGTESDSSGYNPECPECGHWMRWAADGPPDRPTPPRPTWFWHDDDDIGGAR